MTTNLESNKQKAQTVAVTIAAEKLHSVDLEARCHLLGFNPPMSDNVLTVRMFGKSVRFSLPSFDAIILETNQPAKLSDRILLMHYLLCDLPAEPTGTLITFRDLSGGQFYNEPYRSRTVLPLVKRVENNLDLLRSRLNNLDHELVEMGDLGVKIHALGKVSVWLVYYCGEEGFPPSAELLYDSCIKRIYPAEDVAVIGSRICAGLFPEPCVQCCGCGLCDIRTSYIQ